jgi:hypothetical protein
MLIPSIEPALIFDHPQAVAGVGVLLVFGTAVAFAIGVRKCGFVRAANWCLAAGWGLFIWVPVLAGLVYIAPHRPVVAVVGLALLAVVLALFVLAVRRFGIERTGGRFFVASGVLVLGGVFWYLRQGVAIDPGPDAPFQAEAQPDTPVTE